jgi:hypothetical protein
MPKSDLGITLITPDELIVSKIYVIRGQKVMLDKDLAEMYGVQTRVLNQAVKRNKNRFPDDFVFQLTDAEFENLKSQIVISSWGGYRTLPNAFNEQGVSMLSGVLNSPIAIQVHIQIIRIFGKMRELLLSNKDILLKIEKMEQDVIENKQDIAMIFDVLKKRLHPPVNPGKRIGCKPDDL